MYINQTIIGGNIGRDAESKQVGDSNVMSFSVAATHKYTDKAGQPQTDTVWFNVEYWSKTTGILQYLKKGQQVVVQGEMRSRKFTGKDNQEHEVWALRASEIQLCGSPQERKPF